jgi:hypothetical protein
MMNESWNIRSFKGGSWDLRKDERRKEEKSIAFPDRRKESRRTTLQEIDRSASVGLLNWVDRIDLDE